MSAAIVATEAMPTRTASLVSGLRWCSGNRRRKRTPNNAAANRHKKTTPKVRVEFIAREYFCLVSMGNVLDAVQVPRTTRRRILITPKPFAVVNGPQYSLG